MVSPLTEKLTRQFYEWETRLRGWRVYSVPVDLEPGLQPFAHTVKDTGIIDDGKRPTFLSSIQDWFRKEQAIAPVPEKEREWFEAYTAIQDEAQCVFSLSFPKGCKVSGYETEQFLIVLSSCEYPVSFEIIATSERIRVQYACSESDAFHVQNQLRAYFPAAVIQEQEDMLGTLLGNDAVQITEYGLSDEVMCPLAIVGSFDPDPFVSLFGVLDNLQGDQCGAVQILFKRTNNPWAANILQAISTGNGDCFFADAPQLLPLAKLKIAAPLYAVVIRSIGTAVQKSTAAGISRSIGESLIHFSRSESNCLIPLDNTGYDHYEHFEDVLFRQSHRIGMLLNSRELATFVHFPSASIVSRKLERDGKKTKAAPESAIGHPLVLGTNEHQGKMVPVSLSTTQRLRHTHLIGATGTGKSTLLLSMIAQDIAQDTGCAVLDPHGDLIEKILAYIPDHRKHDVLIIDPADTEHPVGFNILSAHSEIEKDILSSDLVAAFRRQSTSWGDQMGSVMANAILAFLESSKGGTLADLRRFLVEKSFRDTHLKTVTDPSIVYYWQKEYPLLKSNSIGSILTRLDSFLRPKLIRNMVVQQKSIDFDRLMNERKIVLVKLSQGLIGAENSYLLGTFITSKIHQAALARQATAETARNDFFLYVDEFQNFVTPSMSSILSGARKYHLGLILAHQSMNQIPDSELASSVIANAGTRICFRLGETDARKLEDGFSYFDAKDLQNLSTGEAIVRVDTPVQDFNLTTIPPAIPTQPESMKEYILSYSRQMFGTPRTEVEAKLLESMHLNEEQLASPNIQTNRLPQNEVPTPPLPTPKTKEPISKPVPIAEKVAPSPPEGKEVTQTDAAQEVIQKAEERQHEALKKRIKRIAEDRNFKATLEAQTPDGKGFVDVLLQRNEKTIACEISVTTNAAWELHNIQKCLSAGYSTVIVCTTDRKAMENIRAAVQEHIPAKERPQVLVLHPDTLMQYLDELIVKEASTETRIKGYRVKVEYGSLSEHDAKHKRESVAKVVVDSLRQQKGSDSKD